MAAEKATGRTGARTAFGGIAAFWILGGSGVDDTAARQVEAESMDDHALPNVSPKTISAKRSFREDIIQIEFSLVLIECEPYSSIFSFDLKTFSKIS